MTALTQQGETSSRRAISSILIGCAMMFVILELGVTWLAALLDQTWAALIVTAVTVLVAVLFEKQAFKHGATQSLRAIGYGKPNPRAILVAAMIGLLMLGFFPIFSLVTGAQITLKANWLWILVGAIALNGIGEETLFRGYVFGGLRREAGLSFRQAGFISMIIFVAVDLLLFVGYPFFVGLLGTLIAVAAAFPMAYLFERGNKTIWAPVVLHVATHTIRLVNVSETQYFTAVGIWLLLQIGMVFLVYLFLNNLLKSQSQDEEQG
jgi:membrane protease YdiL (CAAX protease family)